MRNLLLAGMMLLAFFVRGQERCMIDYPGFPPNHPGFVTDATPILNSDPSAAPTILIVFSGATVVTQYWNGGNPLVLAPAGMTDAEMRESFAITAEDYKLWKVNITTDISRFNATPVNMRFRVIVTPTSAWNPGVGGSAFTGSYGWTDETPAVVFCDRLGMIPKYIGETISHEIGHGAGLSHQSKYSSTCSLEETYHLGFGDIGSPVSWAPIMGNSLYRKQTLWANGQIQLSCMMFQDNIQTVMQVTGWQLRERTTGFTWSGSHSSQVMIQPGIKDSIYLQVSQGSLVSVRCRSLGNVDIKLSLAGQSQEDPDSLHAFLQGYLPPGIHLLEVYGVKGPFAPDYGNGGSALLTVDIQPAAVVADQFNRLQKAGDWLSWEVQIENFANSELQVSTNGRDFATLQRSTAVTGRIYFHPNVTTWVRNRVSSTRGQISLSNILVIRGVMEPWRLYDLAGRLVETGFGPVLKRSKPFGFYNLKGIFTSEIIFIP